ncbi:hypothetical protein SELR_pSRC300170 (plasmid) [Selenomonas ruminantium subsp. lactilytica TAM6421]|uniref:Bacteriophage phiJL001 Gp84 C-terminal domain-containing protein n=1 Tax=Selenomonas ruminantium subsp. lactilytica (strain NBRC 103574 / TAM6421) TaxID=927704 RepID=I0GWF3_SELRL|nr:phage BR0599 family protein [Selenomonas ruminantium]BAL85090.1 hypothetical protein SELR_pSRC300170 [Selenomonas ruminantium subsp. lactilytica TAM6421]
MSVVLPVCMAKAKESGNPFFIELYILNLRTGITRLAACDENIEFAGATYLAVPFQRGDIARNLDTINDSVNISVADCSHEMLQFVMNGFDFRGCSATIVRIQYPESLSNPNALQLVFSGFIDEPTFSDGVLSAKINARLPEINCPNRNYRLACNSEFGDAECCMDLGKENVMVTNVQGSTITLDMDYKEDYWKDGVITVEGESRVISSSSGADIVVNVGFAHDIVGKQAEVVRGCNKTVERCKAYGNMKHYSGFPAIPFESVYR